MQLLLITDSLSYNLDEILESFISVLKYGSFEFTWKFDGQQKVRTLQFQKTNLFWHSAWNILKLPFVVLF